jgi:hypothetical protein
MTSEANGGLMQAIADGLKEVGFSPEIRDLNHFQDDYGLKPVDGEDDNEDDDDDDDKDDEQDDEDEDEGDDSDDIGGSEGYEIVEGNEDDLEE